jgi:predicted nucleic acid-binding protein
MEYLLDTNICIYIIKKKPAEVFDVILVTNNVREFERIAGLKIGNWAK